jgi:hypothetical protein
MTVKVQKEEEPLLVRHNADEASVPAGRRFEGGVVEENMLQQRSRKSSRWRKGCVRTRARSDSQLGKNSEGKRWTYITSILGRTRKVGNRIALNVWDAGASTAKSPL